MTRARRDEFGMDWDHWHYRPLTEATPWGGFSDGHDYAGHPNVPTDGWVLDCPTIEVDAEALLALINAIDRVQVDCEQERLPRLRTMLPGAMTLHLFYDQSEFIRESITDVQVTMVLTICLVIAVIFLFLRSMKTTIIPGLVIPLSLIATFSA